MEDIIISKSNNEETTKSNFIKIDNPFSDFSLKNKKLNTLEVENENGITKSIKQEVDEFQETLKKYSDEIKNNGNSSENDEDDNNLIISWSSSDLVGIKRLSFFKTAVTSNTITNHLSRNDVLDNVKKFTNMK